MRISDWSSDVCSSDLGWYDPFFGAPLNNARLLPFGLYDDQIPAFEELFAESGRDWRRFFDAASRRAALGAEQRKIKLQQIKARASVPVSAYSLKRSHDHVQMRIIRARRSTSFGRSDEDTS